LVSSVILGLINLNLCPCGIVADFKNTDVKHIPFRTVKRTVSKI